MFTLLKRVYALLDPKRRKQYFGLQLLFIFTALIQVAGVASVAPFVALVSNPDFIHDNAAASYVYASLGFESDRAFLVAFAIAVIAFIIFSNAVGALTIWFTVSFAQNFGVELQGALYRNYIYKDYIYHSKHNSSDMIAMIGQEAPRFIYMVMQPMLALLSQLVVIVLISVGLLVIDPMLALLAILIIGGGYLLTFRFVKLHLSYHGDRIFSTIASRLRQLTESLGGIKEVKLLATEKKYEEKIGGKNKIIARSNAVLATLGDGPRFAMETLAFCALLGLAIYLLLHEDSPAKVVPILSLYTIAGYKLLPSAQIIFKAFADIRANRSALDNLFPLVLEGRRIVEADAQVSAAPAIALGDIRCNDLCYTYPDAPAPALRNVNLTIKLNTLVAFAGSSGAGKSTLADILLGFLTPSSGTLVTGDTVIDRSNVRAWQRHLGYVPQNIFLVDDSIAANVAFGTAENEPDKPSVEKALRLANLDALVADLPEGINFGVGERGMRLSGGQRQRVGIARALYHDAEVLVMDEATSALDNLTEQEIVRTITHLKGRKTIIMIAHRLSTIKSADQIVFMEKGSISAIGTFDELCASSAGFRQMALSSVVEAKNDADAPT